MLNEANNSERRARFITARKQSCGKVMFSVVSVCLLFCPQPGVPQQCLGPVPPQTCSNLFNLYLTVEGANLPTHTHTHTCTHAHAFKLSHCGARAVGKRAVGIQLKCFLVVNDNRIAFPQLNPNIDSDFVVLLTERL